MTPSVESCCIPTYKQPWSKFALPDTTSNSYRPWFMNVSAWSSTDNTHVPLTSSTDIYRHTYNYLTNCCPQFWTQHSYHWPKLSLSSAPTVWNSPSSGFSICQAARDFQAYFMINHSDTVDRLGLFSAVTCPGFAREICRRPEISEVKRYTINDISYVPVDIQIANFRAAYRK